jgi:amino acid transporter
MVLSVAAAGVAGIIYLIPILFVLPDVGLLLSIVNGQPIGLIFKIATGSSGGGFGLLFLILGILSFAGVGALTAASRCTYAFARDGATPRILPLVMRRQTIGCPIMGFDVINNRLLRFWLHRKLSYAFSALKSLLR